MPRAAVIHLEAAVERKPIIARIQRLFPSLEIYPAKDGSQWAADPLIKRAHPLTRKTVPQSVMGCAHSHIDLIHDALSKKDSVLAIFEDDCDFSDEITEKEIATYISRADTLGRPWDILLLGGTEYVESKEVSAEYTQVGRFWGTHALILQERGMRAALKAFDAAQKQGIFLLADWMYNEAIRLDSLVCYGPTDPFRLCKQKEGLVSQLTGKVRNYPKVGASR
jgi:GR25 family glycosyltransferase involved in LPS biosynthesis